MCQCFFLCFVLKNGNIYDNSMQRSISKLFLLDGKRTCLIREQLALYRNAASCKSDEDVSVKSLSLNPFSHFIYNSCFYLPSLWPKFFIISNFQFCVLYFINHTLCFQNILNSGCLNPILRS